MSNTQKQSPWETLSSKVVYQNRWVTMREDTVRKPDGKKGIYGFLQIPDGVGIVALYPDRRIHLVGEWRYPIHQYSWSVVCGTREAEETPLRSAKRELEEEAGLVANTWKKLGTIHPSPGLVQETAYLFMAFDCHPVAQRTHLQEPTERFSAQRRTLEQAVAMIRKGEITDSYAVSSILLAKEVLDRGR